MNCKKIKLLSVFLLAIILFTSFNFVLANKLSAITMNKVNVAPESELGNVKTTTTKSTTTTIGLEETRTTSTISTIQTNGGVTTTIDSSSDSINGVVLKSNTTIINKETPTDEIVQTSSQQIEEYKEALNISRVVIAKPRVVARLIERKRINKNNFVRISRISRIIERVEEKEILTEELLDMDQKFVNKLSYNIETKPAVQQQVSNYIRLVRLKKEVKVQIEENKIDDLFNKKISIDDFINQVWNEI